MSKSPAWDNEAFRGDVFSILTKFEVCTEERVVAEFITGAAARAEYGLDRLNRTAAANTEKTDAQLLEDIHAALGQLLVASAHLGEIGISAVLEQTPSRRDFWQTAPAHERVLLAAIDFKHTGEIGAARDLVGRALGTLDPTRRGSGASMNTRAKRQWLEVAAFPVLRLAEEMFGQRVTSTRDGWADRLMARFIVAWQFGGVNTQRLIQRYQRRRRSELKIEKELNDNPRLAEKLKSAAEGMTNWSSYSTGPVTRNPAPIPDLE